MKLRMSLLLAAATATLAGCGGKSSPIVGKWHPQSANVVYDFEPNGDVKAIELQTLNRTYTGKYTFKDNILEIHYTHLKTTASPTEPDMAQYIKHPEEDIKVDQKLKVNFTQDGNMEWISMNVSAGGNGSPMVGGSSGGGGMQAQGFAKTVLEPAD